MKNVILLRSDMQDMLLAVVPNLSFKHPLYTDCEQRRNTEPRRGGMDCFVTFLCSVSFFRVY